MPVNLTTFIDMNVTLTAAFTDENDVAADPTTVTLKVRDSSGLITTFTHPASITKTGVGAYEKTIVVDKGGVWVYFWRGAGALEAAGEGRLTITPDPTC